ncbi:hypothetical protein SLA2020_246110 [Shorea laevis]
MEVGSSSSSSKAGKVFPSVVAGVPRRPFYRNPCFLAIAILLAVVILILILACTVFKVKKPKTTIDSITLDDLSVSLYSYRLGVSLNATIDVGLSIKNPNGIGIKYKNATALLNYRGTQVGQVTIPAGEISAHDTVGVNMTLTIFADRFLSESKQLYSDVKAGSLPLNTYIRISGKVKLLFFKIKVIATASCDFTIDISKKSAADQKCKHKTKL